MRRVSLKQIGLIVGATLAVVLGLAGLLAVLPLRYTPLVVAGLMVLAFLGGGVGFNLYQNWATERVRERHWQAARRELGLDDEPPRRRPKEDR